MKRKRVWLLCPLIVVALLLCAIPAYADMPTLPHAFYGTLTIAGSPAPVGTVVTAEVGEVECGSITTTVAGQYGGSGAFDEKLAVNGEIETNATVYFLVNGTATDPVYDYAFSAGAVTEHNLVVNTDPNPPVVDITPLSPDPTNDNTPTFTGTAIDELSNIASVEYQVGTGSWRVWVEANPVDGAFDSPSEEYTFTIPALADGGYTVYVRATDAASPPNTTAEVDHANDSFTIDTAAPTVSDISPASGATDVALATVVTATFSERMDESTITTGSFTLDGVAGSVSYDFGSYTATFTPAANLTEGTTYTATLTTAVTDAAGNALGAEYSWSFTTTTDDTTPPTVVSTSPASDEIDVAVGANITATFSEAMDVATITTGSFTVAGVSGSVSYNSVTYTATFNPSANLAYETTYTASLSTAITDAAGNPLTSTYSWSFTTEEESGVDPGDANGDGFVNALDITKVERIVAGLDAETPGADANEDGSVNALDITMVEIIIAYP